MKRRLDIAKLALTGALFAALFVPASALAEYYVPPGNSAATQYTEALPSAGGESTGKGGGHTSTPSKSLGSRNAQRLEAQGPAGEAAAEVAAETAPPPSLVAADDGTQGNGSGKSSNGHKSNEKTAGNGAGDDPTTTRAPIHVNQPSGSSGVGEIIAQATGSADSGNLGLWLPIVIVLTAAGSIAYRLRPRSGPTA